MSETIASRMFERYVRRQAARSFAAVHWRSTGVPERWRPDVPTLFVANHSNWWDGGLAFLVSRALGLRFRILMEARQLARYRFFLRIGALPLRREPPGRQHRGRPREHFVVVVNDEDPRRIRRCDA